MKRFFAVCTLTAAFVVGIAGCGDSQAKVQAWVQYNYPGATYLGTISETANDAYQVYVICQSGTVKLVETSTRPSARIWNTLALPSNRASCK